MHRGRHITEEQRFVELYLRAVDDADMPPDPEFRQAVREHIELGSEVAVQNSNAETEDQLNPLREVRRWTWAGEVIATNTEQAGR